MAKSNRFNLLSNYFASYRIYLDRRVLSIFFLGISSGFPQVLIGSCLTLWLKSQGFPRAEVAYVGAVFVMYSINFLWSPMLDRVKLGKWGEKFGQRRSWILCMQFVLVLSCFAMSQFPPITDLNLKLLIGSAIILAAAGATQDIAIDAFRIDSIAEHEKEHISAAAGMATAGWWTGYAGLAYFPLWLVKQPNWSWQEAYLVLTGIMVLLMLVVFFNKEPKSKRDKQTSVIDKQYLDKILNYPRLKTYFLQLSLLLPFLVILWVTFADSYGIPKSVSQHSAWNFIILIIEIMLLTLIIWQVIKVNNYQDENKTANKAKVTLTVKIAARLLSSLAEPLSEFFKRNGVKLAASILLFIFMFKIGEAFLGKMAIQFYDELGFDTKQIGEYSKLTTWIVTIFFAVVGSKEVMRSGIVKALLVSGVAMALSNLMFAWMAYAGKNESLFFATVVIDAFTTAWSSVAFVALLSLLCNRTFTASQYALMASLGSLGRTLLASSGGQIVTWMGGNWALFFVITALMVIPGLVILMLLKPHIDKIESNRI